MRDIKSGEPIRSSSTTFLCHTRHTPMLIQHLGKF